MAWKYNDRIIRVGRGWRDDNGVAHPSGWDSWTDQEKAAAGLIWVDDPKAYDSRFYWDADTPRALEDVHVVDGDKNPVLNEDGSQMVIEGLKTQYKKRTDEELHSRLTPTDRDVLTHLELGTGLAPEVAAQRAGLRSTAEKIKKQIDDAPTFDAFVELMQGTETNEPVMSQWPTTDGV